MRFSRWIGVGLVGIVQAGFVTACQFARPADIDPDAADVDVAPLECTPSTTTCSNDRYTECDLTGHFIRYQVPNGAGVGMPTTLVMDDYECPLGCGDATRCANPVAAHGVASLVPTWSAPLADVDLTTSGGSAITIATDTTRAEIEIADAAGHTFRVPVEVVGQAGGPEILVLEVRSLTIRADARVVARGSRALAIASALDIVIAGRLDAAGVPDAAGGVTTGACVGTTSRTVASGGGGNVHAGGESSDLDPGGAASPPINRYSSADAAGAHWMGWPVVLRVARSSSQVARAFRSRTARSSRSRAAGASPSIRRAMAPIEPPEAAPVASCSSKPASSR